MGWMTPQGSAIGLALLEAAAVESEGAQLSCLILDSAQRIHREKVPALHTRRSTKRCRRPDIFGTRTQTPPGSNFYYIAFICHRRCNLT